MKGWGIAIGCVSIFGVCVGCHSSPDTQERRDEGQSNRLVGTLLSPDATSGRLVVADASELVEFLYELRNDGSAALTGLHFDAG